MKKQIKKFIEALLNVPLIDSDDTKVFPVDELDKLFKEFDLDWISFKDLVDSQKPKDKVEILMHLNGLD
jgi:hypothetical protein